MAPAPEMNHQASPVVELHCVVKSFIHGQPAAQKRTPGNVQGLSLMVMPGEVLVLVGPSGCGKTTTLRLIAGFEQPDRGTVRIQGRLVADRHSSLPPEKRGLGMVFQDYALFPHLSVADNVAFGLHRLSRAARRSRVQEVLDLVGLGALAHRYPHTLSGGQQQRVALARALAPRPPVILLDEPFSNLDAELRSQMRQDVGAILKGSHSTAIFVTHDQQEALLLGDRVAVMRQGFVEQVDVPEDIFHAPRSRFVADFLGTADFLPARVTESGLATEIGLLPPASPFLPGQAVEVMTRPHDLAVEPVSPGEGHGVIDEAMFVGERWQYRVRLHSKRSVRCLMPHTHHYPPDTPVKVILTAEHGLVCFPSDRADPLKSC